MATNILSRAIFANVVGMAGFVLSVGAGFYILNRSLVSAAEADSRAATARSELKTIKDQTSAASEDLKKARTELKEVQSALTSAREQRAALVDAVNQLSQRNDVTQTEIKRVTAVGDSAPAIATIYVQTPSDKRELGQRIVKLLAAEHFVVPPEEVRDDGPRAREGFEAQVRYFHPADAPWANRLVGILGKAGIKATADQTRGSTPKGQCEIWVLR